MTSNKNQKLVIFDTDMGLDDAWALQIILQAEKQLQSVKVLAITTVNGNTTAENAAKNTYRILDGVHRTDVIADIRIAYRMIENFSHFDRYQFTWDQPNQSFATI